LPRQLAVEPSNCQASIPLGRKAADGKERIEDYSPTEFPSSGKTQIATVPDIAAPLSVTRRGNTSKQETELMKIRPLQDRILVKRVDEEAKSKGGIIIPDSAKEKPQEGKVISVGKGRVLEDGTVRKLDVKKGDKILFSKYGGTEVNVNSEEHLIIREDDILGIIE
jgi:chaperonin GroES